MSRAHAVWNASSAKYWLNCGVYTREKLAAEAAGKEWNQPNIHSIRGSALHDVIEGVLREHFAGEIDVDRCIDKHVGIAEGEHDYEVTDDDREQVTVALIASINLVERYGTGVSYLLEQKVPLSHEPESNGYVDLGAIVRSQDVLIVNDHKFGRGEVPPDSYQNKMYAANLLLLLEQKMKWRPKRVILSITQPALYRDAVVHETTPEELEIFRLSVEVEVELQKAGKYSGAKDLDTCTYCPFEEGCKEREDLIRGVMVPVNKALKDQGLTNVEVEHIARNGTAISKIVSECKTKVVNDPAMFPDWYRNSVANARKWSTILDEHDIAHQLRLLDCKDIYNLKSPKQIKDLYPKAEEKIDDFRL